MIIYVDVNGERVQGYQVREKEGFIKYNASKDFLDNPFKYKYVNNDFIIDEEIERIQNAQQKNLEYLTYLKESDWLVLRHMEQMHLGMKTQLSQQEYKDLLEKRQQARDSIVN